MKKIACLLLAMVMITLSACGNSTSSTSADAGSTPAEAPASTTESATEQATEAAAGGKVAIITNTVSQSEEEYRSAEEMVKKYEGRVIHETWPENAVKEQEQMITVMTKLGADQDIKAVVINAAGPGTNAAIDKLREIRDDILVISCNFSENPPDVAKKADVALLGDNSRVGEIYPAQVQKLGAKTIVYYSFPRHLSLSIFSENRDKMMAEAEKLGIEFVQVTAPDPNGDAGIAGAQQFIFEDVPKKVAEYGPDTAFYATNCSMQIPLIQQAMDQKAIYGLPCCPSPLHGFPIALGIDLPEEKKGDIAYVIDETRKALDEAGVLGRFSNFPVPGAYMLTVTGIEYSLKYMDGETNGKFDQAVLEQIMQDYAGVTMSFRLMEDAGVTYDNVLLYLQNFITY